METELLLSDLNKAYIDVNEAVKKAKRATLLYEVFMSDLEYQTGKETVVENIDAYFDALVSTHEKN